jgi:hypothetical protein
MVAYINHGKTSPERKSGWKPKLSERDRHTLKRIVSKYHRTPAAIVSKYHRTPAAEVTAELSIHLEDHFHKIILMRASQIPHPWYDCNC